MVKEYLIPVVIVVAGLALYHMVIAPKLKLSAYEQNYDKL